MFIQRVSDFCAKFNNVLLRTAAYGAVAAGASGVIAYHLTPYVSSFIAPWTASLTKVCYTLPESCNFVNSGILARAKLECLPSELKCIDSEFMIGNILAGTLFGVALTAAFLYKKLHPDNQSVSPLKTAVPLSASVSSPAPDVAAAMEEEVPRIATRSSRIEDETRKAMDILKRGDLGAWHSWLKVTPLMFSFGYILILLKLKESNSFSSFKQDCAFYLKEIPEQLKEDLYGEVRNADVSKLLEGFPGKFKNNTIDPNDPLKKLYDIFSANSQITDEEITLIESFLE